MQIIIIIIENFSFFNIFTKFDFIFSFLAELIILYIHNIILLNIIALQLSKNIMKYL